VVVCVQHPESAVGRRPCGYRPETVLRIVGIQEPVVACHVAVGVVNEGCLRRAGGSAPYQRILIEAVGGVDVRDEVRRGPKAVADGVIGVAVLIHADCRGGEFRAVVVQPFAHERDRVGRVRRLRQYLVLAHGCITLSLVAFFWT